MALLGDIQIRGDGSDPRQIMNYLYQLEEQIQYALQNIGADNIVAGSIGPELLAPAIKTQINNVVLGQQAQQRTSKQLKSEDGKLRALIVETEQGIMRQLTNEVNGLQTTITETAAGINARITDEVNGLENNIRVTAEGISARITNEVAGLDGRISATAAGIRTDFQTALGNYSTTQQTADAIAQYVGNALGDYSTTQQTADAIAMYVGNNSYEKVSGITIDANGISMTGSQSITLDAGAVISIGTGFKAGLSRSQIKNLDIYSALEDDYININNEMDQLYHSGWVESAAVNGNTLTLTLSSGQTVTFTPT